MNYAGQFNAQTLSSWTSVWGGGGLPKDKHGTAVISPGMSVRMTPGGPWDTFYQLQRMPAQNASQTVTYHVAYRVSDTDLAACQALEFEIQRNDGHTILNGGVQFDLKDTRKVRTYDFGVGHWIATDIPCNDSLLSGGKLLDVVAVYDLMPSAITFRGLQINGLWAALGIIRPGVAKQQSPYLNYATQFDFTSAVQVATMQNPCIDIVVT